MISGSPQEGQPIPLSVHAIAAGRPVRAVWQNEAGGIPYEVGSGDTRRFVKWSPHAGGIDLTREVARLQWAASFTRTPTLLDYGSDSTASWIVTEPLPGQSAVSPRWKAEPRAAVATIGAGLRELHDSLPVGDCPFGWSANERRAQGPPAAQRRGRLRRA